MTTKKYADFNCSTRSNFVTMQISQKEKKTNYKQGQLGAALEEASKTRFSMYTKLGPWTTASFEKLGTELSSVKHHIYHI